MLLFAIPRSLGWGILMFQHAGFFGRVKIVGLRDSD